MVPPRAPTMAPEGTIRLLTLPGARPMLAAPMPVDLDALLVVGISSRALFDLEAANAVFEHEGLDAYREYQRQHEQELLKPGTAFPLVKGLLDINRRAGEHLVEVVILSRNDAESAMRVFRSIEHYGLDISRGIFRGGRDPWQMLRALSCDIYLTAEPSHVLKAHEIGVPAALIMAPPPGAGLPDTSEVRIAFDGDAVLFDAASQHIFDVDGLDAFHSHEEEHAEVALSSGPLRSFLDGLARVQARFSGESPIRIALVTSRGAPAHYRVVHTLRAWGVRIDETYFLGGADKTEALAAFGAHIFFDDQLVHAERAASRIPAAQVLWPREVLAAIEGSPEAPAGAPAGPVRVPARQRSRGAAVQKPAGRVPGASGAAPGVSAAASSPPADALSPPAIRAKRQSAVVRSRCEGGSGPG
jgi:5'-nucleotidase